MIIRLLVAVMACHQAQFLNQFDPPTRYSSMVTMLRNMSSLCRRGFCGCDVFDIYDHNQTDQYALLFNAGSVLELDRGVVFVS